MGELERKIATVIRNVQTAARPGQRRTVQIKACMRKLAALSMKHMKAMAQHDRMSQEVQNLQEEMEASQAQMAESVRRSYIQQAHVKCGRAQGECKKLSAQDAELSSAPRTDQGCVAREARPARAEEIDWLYMTLASFAY